MALSGRSENPGQTPGKGLTAVLGTEIGTNTKVRLGVACAVGLVLLGGIMWLTNLHEKLSVLESKVEAASTMQKNEKDATDKRLERIEEKLDQLLLRRP